MVTIKDIAREADVSFTTVSNVIHGNTKRVSAGTVERINEIMKKRGYVPNMGARALVGSKTKLIAFAYQSYQPVAESNVMEDTFVSQLTGELERCIHEADYDMMLTFVDSQNGMVAAAQRWNADGIVVLGATPQQCTRLLEATQKPIAFIDCSLEDGSESIRKNYVTVTLDDRAAAYEMTKYLIACGHKKIGFVCRTTVEYKNPDSLRREGYTAAMREAGLDVPENWTMYMGPTYNMRRKALAEIYARRSEFTALFSTADMDAASIENYLQDLGVRVPQDISVAGFDGNYMSSMVRPTLTTMYQDTSAKAAAAIDGLVALMSGSTPEKRDIRIPVRLIERNSVTVIK